MSDAFKVRAFDSAYPGSMSEKDHGGYVERDDAKSLAGALLALIKSGDDANEYAHDRIAALESQLAAVTAERDAALVDAGRYRWLRANIAWSSDLQTRTYYYRVPNYTELDAAIDAAISESNAELTGAKRPG
jgi:hypothetical protein